MYRLIREHHLDAPFHNELWNTWSALNRLPYKMSLSLVSALSRKQVVTLATLRMMARVFLETRPDIVILALLRWNHIAGLFFWVCTDNKGLLPWAGSYDLTKKRSCHPVPQYGILLKVTVPLAAGNLLIFYSHSLMEG